MKNIRNVLFDLDGTLTDSAPGIIHAYQNVAQKMDVKAPPLQRLIEYIGSPLRKNLAEYVPCGRIEEAVDHYFQYYDLMRIGLTENSLYDGILDVLSGLKAQGCALYVVTAKPREFTLPILSLFGLEPFFREVYADALMNYAGELEHDLVAALLRDERLDPNETVMVGDRAHDVVRAHNNNIKSIAVTWGYGSREELMCAVPDAVANAPEELLALLCDDLFDETSVVA